MDEGTKEITVKTLLFSTLAAVLFPLTAWAQATDPNDKFRGKPKTHSLLGGNRYYAHDAGLEGHVHNG